MSKNIKSTLSDAVQRGVEVTFNYTDLKGSASTRTVTPEEFVSGLHGEAVVAVDADGSRRRFLIGSISNLSD